MKASSRHHGTGRPSTISRIIWRRARWLNHSISAASPALITWLEEEPDEATDVSDELSSELLAGSFAGGSGSATAHAVPDDKDADALYVLPQEAPRLEKTVRHNQLDPLGSDSLKN